MQAGRGTGTVGGDDDAEAAPDQFRQAVGEAGAVTRDRPPARRLDERCLGRLGRGVDRPESTRLREQRVGVGVQAREATVRVAGPRRCERAGEVVLLGDQVDRPVAHPPRFDQHELGAVRQHVGEQPVVLDEPGQPTLHAVEVGALRQPLPLLAAPRLRLHELRRRGPDVVGRHQLAGREDVDLGDVADRSLVVHAERGQPVDLVTPQVDADRRVGGGGVDVDDRATAGELAAVLDEFLAAVPELDERPRQLIRVDLGARANDDGFDRGRTGTEFLQQRPHPGDDDRRDACGIAQPPEDLEALAHRLHARADPLERQRLPTGEVDDVVGGQELAQVVGELAGHRAGRAGDDQRAARRQVRERGDRDRPRHLHHGQAGVRIAEGAGEAGLAAEQLRQRTEGGGRRLDHRASRRVSHRVPWKIIAGH